MSRILGWREQIELGLPAPRWYRLLEKVGIPVALLIGIFIGHLIAHALR